MKRELLSGNEAIARGAYEAGVQVCSAYPGTPSTEIFENLTLYGGELYCEWAPNEKVAAEVAYGASIANVRSLCAMKHVGVNVAADLLFTAAYNGVGRGFVIVSADDPSMHSSQNEQDNRHYARAAKIAMIEPSDSQECLDFLKVAYEISERFDMPVLFRITTRIAHSKSVVVAGARRAQPVLAYVKNSKKNIGTPANAYENHAKVEQNLLALETYGCTSPLNRAEYNGAKLGVITASVAYQYAKDAFPEDTSFLKLGLTYPLPMSLIREFASRVETLYVVEELDGFMEEQIRAAGIVCSGKDMTGKLYELNPQLLRERIFGKERMKTDNGAAGSRPPVLCPGCPHRGFFYTMAQHKDIVVSGDIGCYTLGANAPLSAIDSMVCMGGGFSVAMGMAKAFEKTGQTEKKVFGVMGDSTFFHSGMTGAAEIIYNRGNVIPVVLDNSITGMTGHQENPGSGYTLNGESAETLRIEEILSSMGYRDIFIVDPQDLNAMDKAVQDALTSAVPAAIIARRPCILIKRIRHDIGGCRVDASKCIGCKKCLKVGCPAIMMREKKAVIDEKQCVGCTICAQVCPKGAIQRMEAQGR